MTGEIFFLFVQSHGNIINNIIGAFFRTDIITFQRTPKRNPGGIGSNCFIMEFYGKRILGRGIIQIFYPTILIQRKTVYGRDILKITAFILLYLLARCIVYYRTEIFNIYFVIIVNT